MQQGSVKNTRVNVQPKKAYARRARGGGAYSTGK